MHQRVNDMANKTANMYKLKQTFTPTCSCLEKDGIQALVKYIKVVTAVFLDT